MIIKRKIQHYRLIKSILIDLFLAFHAMLEKKIASLLKQLLLVTMFPSKKNHRYFRAYASSTEREGSVV